MTELEEIKSMLAQLINRPPLVPVERMIWDATECAAHLRCTPRHFSEVIAMCQECPRPIRLPGTGTRGLKRWKAREIIRYAEGL